MSEANYLAGRLLLAMPGMGDPRFDHAVIAMCVHDENGAFGLGIGHLRSGISCHELLRELDIEPGVAPDCPVHHGGPVEPGRGFVLHSADWDSAETMAVPQLGAVSASLDILRAIAEGRGPQKWLIALGYAGWAAGQLDGEMRRHGWYAANGRQDIVFATPSEGRWSAAWRAEGIDPALLASETGERLMPDYPVRVPPLDPARFTPEQAELVGAWTHLNFSKVIARHPGMYRTFVPFIEQLIARTILPPRDREVLVIRTLGLADEVYEAKHHADIAARSDLSPADVARIATGGPDLPDWDRLLVTAAEELVSGQRVGDATWTALAARYSEAQLMEVVFLVGCYATMAMLTKSFGIEVEMDPDADAKLSALRQYT